VGKVSRDSDAHSRFLLAPQNPAPPGSCDSAFIWGLNSIIIPPSSIEAIIFEENMTKILAILLCGVLLAIVGCSQGDSSTPTASSTGTTASGTTASGTSSPTTGPSANSRTTASGLIITDLKEGSGTAAVTGDTVEVNYTGTFKDGKKFDSSYDHNQTFSFGLGQRQVIAGWDEGVVGMKPGGKRQLIIPPSLGYGANDNGPIPGNSTLYFDIELVSIHH
jgi:peptidylprolyl isomerase